MKGSLLTVFAFICVVSCSIDFLQFGYVPPQQLHLALTGDPSEMVVSWLTTLPTAESIVEVELHGVFHGNQSSYLYSAGWIHHVVVTGLKPSKTYKYICGSFKNGLSEQYEFITAPTVGSRDNRNLIIYGDMGIVQYSYYTVEHVTQLVNNDSIPIDFIYHSGDMGYGNDRAAMYYEVSWNLFFEQMQLAMAKVPYMVAPGNHEASCGHPECDFYANNFTVYNYRYRMPGKESGSNTNMWFSFDYGNIHFISISTETDYPNNPNPTDTFGDQLGWLETDLQKASTDSNIDWIIATGHQPLYSSVSGKSEGGIPVGSTRYVQQAFEKLFHTYGVDVYFDGHVHGYERTFPVYDSIVRGDNTQNEYYNPPATVYVVNGNAGNIEGFYTEWDTRIPSWSAKRYWPNPKHGYGILQTFGADSLRWTWYSNDLDPFASPAQYYDYFVITRNTTAVSPAPPPSPVTSK